MPWKATSQEDGAALLRFLPPGEHAAPDGDGDEDGRRIRDGEGHADRVSPAGLPAVIGSLGTVESLSGIINSISDPIFVKDVRHRLVLVNDAECALAGLSREQLLGWTHYEALPPDQRDVFWEQDDHVIATGEESVSEEEMADAAGDLRTLSTRKTRFTDAVGNRFVVGVIRDITERRRAERAVRAAKEYAENLIATADAMVVGLDPSGRVEVFNPAAERITGYTLAELQGRDWFEILTPRARYPGVWDEFERVVAGRGHAEFENPILTRQGEERFIAWRNSAVIERGVVRGTISFGIDITERRRAEERLAILAAAVEQAADDIVVTDPEARIRYVNPAFERTTGYTMDEARGRDVNELLCPGMEPGLIASIGKAIRAGKPWQGRFSNRARDGRVILLDASVSAIRDAAGRITGVVSARRDVTRQVAMEEHAARTDKLEAIGTLAGGIAHDFNNILGAIVGYTQLAQRKCAPDAAVQRDLDAVLQGSHRATELVRQILAFSRQTEQEERPVQVGPIVKEAMKLLRPSIPGTIEIRTQVRTQAVVLADPGAIHRVLVNLCTNAAIAMRERGGLLEIALDDLDPDADVAARHPGLPPGRCLRLRVRDTGCGMSREVMARIFEPFYTTRPQGEGTGMGLAVVHGIVTRCRGAIGVESEPGQGTVFEILLPAVASKPAESRSVAEALVTGSERVFVVDDEPLLLETMGTMLGMLGYVVRTFGRGAEALAAFEADPAAVDLVLTDRTMPGLTGEQLARRLKQARPDLPVVLCSGYAGAAPAGTAQTACIDAFAMKPVTMEQLARLVREALDRALPRAA
jgi:PAS domain S-box-containing protein